MIEVLQGKGVGAGKSYYVITRIIKLVARGGTVFISDAMEVFPEKMSKLIEARYGVIMEPDQIRVVPREDVWRVHELTASGTEDNPVLIVLDEVQDALNSRDWNDKSKRGLFAWCCQSRHDDNDLLFITQHEANIDKQVRRLATFSHTVRNMQKFKIPGIGRLPPPWRNRFLLSTFDAGTTNLLDKVWVPMDKEIFGCYRSKAMRGTHKRNGEPIPKKRLQRKTSRSPKMKWIVIIGVLILIPLGIHSYNSMRALASPQAVPATAETTASVHSNTMAPSRPLATMPDSGFDVVEQIFRATDGATYLVTSRDEYYLHQLCGEGMVVAIQDRTVKIKQPNGRTLYVIGRDSVSGDHQEIIHDAPIAQDDHAGGSTFAPILSVPNRSVMSSAGVLQGASLPVPSYHKAFVTPSPTAAGNIIQQPWVPITAYPRFVGNKPVQ